MTEPALTIVEKVAKLLKLAESSNEHEAAAAMARAQQLMLEHAIEDFHLREVATNDTKLLTIIHRRYDVPSRTTGVKAKRSLLNTVAGANRCRVVKYGAQSSTHYEITGSDTDVTFVVNLYESLLRQMDRALRADTRSTSTTAKNNFQWGYVVRVSERLATAMLHTKKQLAEANQDFLPALRSVEQEVERAFAKKYPSLRAASFGKPGAYDSTARARGREAGNKADLAGARGSIAG